MSENISGNGGKQIVSPARLSHAVLRTTRFKEMIDWYQTVLGAKVLFQNQILAFMTYDDEHHRLALAAIPGTIEKPKHSAGLDHLAFFYTTLADWIGNYERLKAAGITPRVCIHHGITMSLYYRDPDGNGVELAIDAIDKADWHRWMRGEMGGQFRDNPIGVALDPDEIARKLHAGAPEAELRRYDSSAKLNPEMMRRLGE